MWLSPTSQLAHVATFTFPLLPLFHLFHLHKASVKDGLDRPGYLGRAEYASRRIRGVFARALAIEPHALHAMRVRRRNVVVPAARDMHPLAAADAGQSLKRTEVPRRGLVATHTLGRHE